MIHHASIDVASLEKSGHFYDMVLGPLGWRRLVDTDSVIGWGMVRPVFFVSDVRPPGSGGWKLCFKAKTIPAVKHSWESGINAGGSDAGEPSLRPEYGSTYYSAYLRDPDGYYIEVAVGND